MEGDDGFGCHPLLACCRMLMGGKLIIFAGYAKVCENCLVLHFMR